MHQTDPPTAPTSLKPLLSTSPDLSQCTLALRFLDEQILLQRRDPKTGAQLDYFISPQDTASCFLNVPQDSGWLPSSVIRHGRKNGKDWVVIYEPPTTRNLHLACDSKFQPVDDTFVQIKVPFPGICSLLSGGSAWAWALKGTTFQHRSVAYWLPLPNVSKEGLLCFGSQDHPLVTNRNARQVLSIWLTGTFNSHQVGQKCHRHEKDVRHLLWDMHQRKVKRFPVDELIGGHSIDSTIQNRLSYL